MWLWALGGGAVDDRFQAVVCPSGLEHKHLLGPTRFQGNHCIINTLIQTPKRIHAGVQSPENTVLFPDIDGSEFRGALSSSEFSEGSSSTLAVSFLQFCVGKREGFRVEGVGSKYHPWASRHRVNVGSSQELYGNTRPTYPDPYSRLPQTIIALHHSTEQTLRRSHRHGSLVDMLQHSSHSNSAKIQNV